MTVFDLSLADDAQPGTMLLCRECLSEYSANAHDYFAAAPDTELTCCDAPLVLVRKSVVFEEVAYG